jgi:HEAT repeat protein
MFQLHQPLTSNPEYPMTHEFKLKLQAIVEKLAPEGRAMAEKDIDDLLRAGADSTDDLFLILQAERLDPDLREAACWVLAKLGGDQVQQCLLDVLRDFVPALRSTAARSLGELGSAAAVQPLESLLGDSNVEVRVSAAYALGLLGDKHAVEQLIKKLADESEDPRVRGTIAEALADLRDQAAVVPLIGALKDQSVEVRFWAAFALGQLGDPRAVPELERLAASDQAALPGYGAVSAEATEAIQNIQARIKNQSR